MKRLTIVMSVVLTVFLQTTIVFSADTQKGVIKSVDAKTGTVIVTSPAGQDRTFMADKSLELDAVKPGDKVEISVENNTVKSIKQDRTNWCPKGF